MKQNRVVCQPGPALLFFIFRFEYFISGPKSYRDFRETGPWSSLVLEASINAQFPAVIFGTISEKSFFNAIKQPTHTLMKEARGCRGKRK